jgi:hypothetical protein
MFTLTTKKAAEISAFAELSAKRPGALGASLYFIEGAIAKNSKSAEP